MLYHFLRVLIKPQEEGLHIFNIFNHMHAHIKQEGRQEWSSLRQKPTPKFQRTDRGKSHHFAHNMVITESDGKHHGYKN